MSERQRRKQLHEVQPDQVWAGVIGDQRDRTLLITSVDGERAGYTVLAKARGRRRVNKTPGSIAVSQLHLRYELREGPGAPA